MISIRRLLVTIAAFVLFAVALAPAGFAGEDEEDGEGGGDSGAAGGGAGAGAGGMAGADGSLVVPLALAGGGLVLLTFGAGTLRRRNEEF